MNSKQAIEQIVKILKQVKPEGNTVKKQFHQLYLKTKAIDRTIDRVYFSVGKSYNEAEAEAAKPLPKLEPKTEPIEEISDPASELLAILQGMNGSQVKGFAKIQAKKENTTTKDFLIEAAEMLGVDASGTMDEISNNIADKINEA